MGYFGLGLSMTQLGGNIFVEFILGAAVEVVRWILREMFVDDISRSLATYFVLSS